MKDVLEYRVEFGEPPITRVAVRCPVCERWYRANDIIFDDDRVDRPSCIRFEGQLDLAIYECPKCKTRFDALNFKVVKVQECGYPEVYKGCIEKKEVWE